MVRDIHGGSGGLHLGGYRGGVALRLRLQGGPQFRMDLPEDIVKFLKFSLSDLRITIEGHVMSLGNRCSRV